MLLAVSLDISSVDAFGDFVDILNVTAVALPCASSDTNERKKRGVVYECVGLYWRTHVLVSSVMPYRGMIQVMHNSPALLHECATSHGIKRAIWYKDQILLP